MEENNNKKSLVQKVFRDEAKWIIIIIGFVLSIFIPMLTYQKQNELNSYRITKIENARAEVWIKQDEINKKQTEYLAAIKEDLAIIKTKMGIVK